MENVIRVMLVDDHRVVLQGLQSYLEAFTDIRVVGTATDAEDALARLDEWLPDVALMDLLMPGRMDGIEAIRLLRQRSPHTQVVVLTASSDEARLVAALRVGAIGYVRKEAKPEVLLATVRAAARGQSMIDSSVAGVVLKDLQRRTLNDHALSEREMEVLRQLAHGRTNREIGDALFVSEETIKTHVGNILTKLQLAHRTQAVIYALKQGLISLDELDL